MSIDAITAVWKESGMKGSALLVLLALADYADDDFRSFPKLKTLAEKTRLSERQVQRILRDIEDEGELVTIQGPTLHSPNTYWIKVGGDKLSPGDTHVTPPRHPCHQGGDIGVASKEQPSEESSVQPSAARRPTATQLEAEAIARCWAYFFEIFPGKRERPIDSTSKGLIRNALKLVGEDATKRALLGLSRSPFHQGQNEQRKKYQELRHALKGKQRDGESDAERIERAITWAAEYAPGAQNVDSAKVHRWLADVQYTRSLPHRPERERAKESYRKLVAAGFKVVQLDAPPWVRLER